jgi:hypothetical protein
VARLEKKLYICRRSVYERKLGGHASVSYSTSAILPKSSHFFRCFSHVRHLQLSKKKVSGKLARVVHFSLTTLGHFSKKKVHVLVKMVIKVTESSKEQ